MKKALVYFLLIVFCESLTIANAQSSAPTILSAGDISITGFDAGNGDIAFVSWVNLAPNTKINFTNNGWLSSAPTTTANNARNLEEIATWTNTTGITIAAGTTIVLATATPYTANYGSTTVFSNSGGTNPNLKIQDGDQITVYQTNSTGTGFSPDNSATATFSGTAISIVTWLNNWVSSGAVTDATTYLPSELAANSTFFTTPYLNPYLQYSGTRINKTISEYKTEIQKAGTNWKNIWAIPMNSTAFALPAPANADLSNLTISSATLSPDFASGTITYTAIVANTVTSLTVTPTVADATTSVSVNGTAVTSGNASNAITLNVGSNTITVAVTALDKVTTKTYTITVTRAASSNADLSDLAINHGTLSPVFAAGTTSFTATVANIIKKLMVTPTVSDPTATITVNGKPVNSGSASDTILLTVGANKITIEVTAQDGTTVKTYTITANRGIKKPSVPNITKSSDMGISNTDNITNINTPVFVGTSDANATIVLSDSSASNIQIGTGVADSAGNWTITSTMLADGPHKIKSKANMNGVESALSNALSLIIDTKAPSVTGISRLNPDTAATSANTVTYRISFDEKVGGISTGNFVLTPSGTVKGTITSVSSDTGTTADVTVNNISGEGKLRLDVSNNTTMTDAAGNLLPGNFTTGEEYTITSGSTLPVTLTDFKASPNGKAVQITWKAIAEVNIAKYEIERSSAGINFTKAGEIVAKGNASTNIDYNWTDNHPANGNNFYRLRIIDKNGTVKYTEIKVVNFNISMEFIKASPNPVTNKTLKLTLGNIAAGTFEVALYNSKGQKVFTNTILHDGGSSTKRIQLPSLLTRGAYILHFTNGDLQLNKAIIIE